MKNINRRESPRIDIKLRCHVTSPALWVRGSMYTENISRSGLLVVWRCEDPALPLPSIGQVVTIEIELPANHGFGQKCIHCQGAIARVSPAEGDGETRVALRVNIYNALNINTATAVTPLSGPNFNIPTAITRPLLAEVGLTYTF